MSFKRKLLEIGTSLLKKGIEIAIPGKASQIFINIAQELTPIVTQDTDIGPLKFFCPGILPEYRAKTLLTKEPETIEWIHTFGSDDIMWDIGANVGVYSLYAALRGNRVCSFEHFFCMQ